MAQSAFYYYNSEPALEQRHPSPFTSHPSHGVTLSTTTTSNNNHSSSSSSSMHRFQQQQQQQPPVMYTSEMMMQQRLPPQSARPSSSSSHMSASMYMAPTSFAVPSSMTPSASPRPAVTTAAVMAYGTPSQQLSLDTECATVGYEYPATPALSVSGSTAGSPPTNAHGGGVATPTHAAFFSQLEAARPTSDVDSTSENLAGEASWTRCGSPPLTPLLVSSPRHPPKQDALLAVSATSCPSLSRSTSPIPRSVTSDPHAHFTFCDPRTVFDSPHSVASAPQFDLPPLDLYATHDDEYHAGMAFAATTASHITSTGTTTATKAGSYAPYDASLSAVAPFEHFTDLDSDADLHDLSRFHAAQGLPMTLKRQRLDHLAYSDDGFLSEDSFGEFEEMNRFGVATLYSNPAYYALHPAAAELKPKAKKRCLTGKRATSASPNVRHPRSATDELSEPESTLSAYTDPAPSLAYTHGTLSADAHAHPHHPPPHHHHHPVARRGRKQSLTADPSKTFVCTLCARRFRRQEHLKRHYRSLHTHDKPFACTDCGKTFSRSDNLAQHARTHGSGAVVMGVLEEGELLARSSGDEAFGGRSDEGEVEADGRRE